MGQYLKKSVVIATLIAAAIIVGMLIWSGPQTVAGQFKNVSMPHMLIYVVASLEHILLSLYRSRQ